MAWSGIRGVAATSLLIVCMMVGVQGTYLVPTWNTPQSLPHDLMWAATEYTEEGVFLLGGQYGFLSANDEIVHFDPVTGRSTVMAATLPEPYTAQASATDPETGLVYLFGGKLGQSPWWSDKVLRFDPWSQMVEELPVTLPQATAYGSAAWMGDKAYLFGGDTPDGYTDEILSFDPERMVVEDAGVDLPFPRMGTTVVATGDDHAFLFGGFGYIGYTGQIARFYPDTPELTFNFNAPLPSPRSFVSAVWDPVADTAYVMGGATNEGMTDQVVTVTLGPTGDYVATDLAEPLPSPRYGAMTASGTVHQHTPYVGTDHAFLIGGWEDGTGYLDEVLEFNFRPGPPTS